MGPRQPSGRGAALPPIPETKATTMTNPVTTFADRHIGPSLADRRAMLATLGVPSVETLIAQAVPKSIRLNPPLALPAPAGEADALVELASKMGANRVLKSFI